MLPNPVVIRGSSSSNGREQTHSQTLGEAQRMLLRSGREDCRSQRDPGYYKKTYRINKAELTGAHRDWTDSQEPAWVNPSPCYSCVPCCFMGSPNQGSRGYFWCSGLLLGHLSAYWEPSPCVIWGELPNLIATWNVMLVDIPGRPDIFWSDTEEWIGKEEEGRVNGGKGNCNNVWENRLIKGFTWEFRDWVGGSRDCIVCVCVYNISPVGYPPKLTFPE